MAEKAEMRKAAEKEAAKLIKEKAKKGGDSQPKGKSGQSGKSHRKFGGLKKRKFKMKGAK